MSTKSRKKVGFSDDVQDKSQRESRSRSRSRFKDRRARSQDVRSTTKKEPIPKKRERSLVALVRTGSQKSVRNLVKLFETRTISTMNEGRKSQIVLPDERRLDIIIQPKLTSKDLLDLVASHFKLKEKDYFGLSFQDDTGHYNWLNLDKRVLDHDFPRKVNVLLLYFGVRFYVESIKNLKDTSTVELFYLNAKQAVFKGQIESDSETVFELAAYVLQTTHGDYVDDETTRSDLKKLPVIPTSALRQHPSISYCEDRVIGYYKKFAGTSKGLSIVNYMTIVESLPTYGIHYYQVKDKKDIPWWLGVSYKGIAVYDKADKTTPRKIYTWKLLENLYYRDKKFSIEVHDPKRVVHTLSSFNLYEDAIREPLDEFDELSDAISDPTTQVSVSRRTFGPGNVSVHAWFGATPQLTKCIWSMAVAQHQFYLDRKHSSKASLPSVRSVSEIAAELSRSTTSLPGSLGSDISRSGSSASLPSLSTSRFDLNFDHIDSVKVQREMYQALKARRDALDETLKKKLEELKLLCIKEGELTGRLPPEMPLAPGENPPQIRRRMGTAFSLSSKIPTAENEDVLSKLELEYELQKQITSAALKLSQDKAVSKYVRKQRRQSLYKAQTKLKEMEKKLNEMRRQAGKDEFVKSLTTYDVLESLSPTQSPEVHRQRRQEYIDPGGGDSPTIPSIQRSATARELSPTSPPPLSPTLSSPQLCVGYNGSKSGQHLQMYPGLVNRSHSSGSNMSNQSEYENVRSNNRYDTGSQDSGFSSANNMYNLMTQRKSHYDSTDVLQTPTNKEPYENFDTAFDDKLQLSSRHGSLDGSYGKSLSPLNYGSLERNPKRRNEHWDRRDRKFSDSEKDLNLQDLEPSKYGSKRNSRSEYDLSTPRNSLVEVPVTHEASSHTRSNNYRRDSGRWQDTCKPEPSPIIKSPSQQQTNSEYTSSQCYSPRGHEGSFHGHSGGKYSDYSPVPKRIESPHAQSSALVTVTKLQPHQSVEVVSKPFEMSDFYKYSEKIRRQRMIDQYQQQLMGVERLSRCSSPSQHSSDSGDNTSHSGGGSGGTGPYRHQHNHQQSNLSPSHSSSSVHRSGSSLGYGNPSHQIASSSPYPSHKRDYQVTSHGSPKIVKEQTHVQYSVQTASGQRVYKSVQTTKHTHYQPLTPLKCDPVRNQSVTPNSTPSSRNYNHSGRKQHQPPKEQYISPNQSISVANTHISVADDFTDEMLAWYEDKDTVPSLPSFV